MSLITEEQREELRNKPAEELAKIIKKRKPELSDENALWLAEGSKSALVKDLFWELADIGTSIEQKAKTLEKSPKTLSAYRHYLSALGVIKPYDKRVYDTADLVKADQRFPDTNALREEINQHIKEGEEFTAGEIAKRLSIPKLKRDQAVGRYGINYKAYDELQSLLSLETRKGNLKRRKDDGVHHYTRVNKFPPVKRSYFEKELYTKDDLIDADKRFINQDALREAINQLEKKGEFTAVEMAERLDIPTVWPDMAIKAYGIDYRAYQILTSLLWFEAKRGNLGKRREDERCIYSLEGAMPLTFRHAVLPSIRRYREREKKKHPPKFRIRKERQLEIMDIYLDAVDKVGPCTVRQVKEELGVVYDSAANAIKRLRKKDKIIMIENPGFGTIYKFFNDIFPKRGYLVLNPYNESHLKKMAAGMIDCLPDPVYPWFIEHLDGQLDNLEKAGLPKSVTDRVRNAYKKDHSQES